MTIGFEHRDATMSSHEVAAMVRKPHEEVLQDIHMLFEMLGANRRPKLNAQQPLEHHLDQRLVLGLFTLPFVVGYGPAYGRPGWAEVHAWFVEKEAGSVEPFEAEEFVRLLVKFHANTMSKAVRKEREAAALGSPGARAFLRAVKVLGFAEDHIEP